MLKFILYILYVCSLIFNNTGIYNYLKFSVEMNQLKQIQNELINEEKNLQKQAEHLQTDSAYIKNLVRKKLKRVDPGEKNFLIQKK